MERGVSFTEVCPVVLAGNLEMNPWALQQGLLVSLFGSSSILGMWDVGYSRDKAAMFCLSGLF